MAHFFSCMLVSGLVFSAAAMGQENVIPARNEDSQIELPASPQNWLNSPPINLKDLEQKAAYLFLVEESKCNYWKRLWPKLIASSAAFADQPIVFIAVITGKREKVTEYVRSCGITWPIVVFDPRDPGVLNQPGTLDDWLYWSADRSRCWFARHAQLRLPNGRLTVATGDSEDLDRLARQALKDARWTVDPAGIPAGLREAWQAIEFGYAASAAGGVRQGLRSKNASLRSAAEALQAGVVKMSQAQMASAESLQAQGEAWKACQTLQAAKAKYAGFELPPEIDERLAEWLAAPEVQRELAADKALALVSKKMATGGANRIGRAKRSLEKLIQDHPQTEAARRAQRILDAGV